MAKMTGLGKGLDALFGGAPSPLEIKNEPEIQEEKLDEKGELKTQIIMQIKQYQIW